MDLGTLMGSIGLEDSKFTSVLMGAVDKLADFGRKGAKIAGVAGATIALALAGSIVANLSVDAANDKLSAQLGLTQAESERIGGVAGQLYADAYGESMEQVNDAVASVMTSIDGMSTASDAVLQGATTRVLDFASAFGVDVTRSAQLAGQMIRTGLAADADEAFDLLVTSSQRVPAALRDDLLDAVDEYGQFFSTLGYSGEQAFAVLVEGSEKGMYGIDKAGDAVKEFTIRATDMSTASKAAYDTIGLDAEDMANKILKGGDDAAGATQQVIDGLLGIKDPATQANTAIALFGTPIEDLNTSEIPAFLKSLSSGSDAMDGFSGGAERMGETLNSNAQTSITQWKRTAQQAFLGLGNWAIPHVDALADAAATNLGPGLEVAGDAMAWLWGASQDAIGFIEDHQTTFSIIAGIIMTLLVPAFIALGVQASIAAAKTVAGWVATAAGATMSAGLQLASLTLMGGRWIWAGAQALLGAARMAAAWLIALGPIGLAIAAIVAVVVAVVKNWDTIKAKTAAVWDWVVSKVKKVPGMIVGFFLNFTLPGLIIKHWDSIKNTFSKGADKVVSFMKSLPGRLLRAVGNLGSLLRGVGEDIMNGLVRGIDKGLGWVRSKLSGVGRLIPGWLKKVLGISSPSKVMRDQVGQWIPAGIAEGVDDGIGRFLTPALDRMAGATVIPITAAASYQASVDAANRSTSGVGGLSATGTDGMPAGTTVNQVINAAPGMNEKQVGDAAANRAVFALGNG
jgi:hypothetical protein